MNICLWIAYTVLSTSTFVWGASNNIKELITKHEATCFLPVSKGFCNGREIRYYYDHKTFGCRIFEYTGCKGNMNNFKTERECLNRCAGKVPNQSNSILTDDDRGPLQIRHRMFYYSPTRRDGGGPTVIRIRKIRKLRKGRKYRNNKWRHSKHRSPHSNRRSYVMKNISPF